MVIEFFAITDLAVSVRPKSEFYVCLSVDTWYLKIQVHSRTSLLPFLVFIITLYISTTSKNHSSCLPDLAETAKLLISKIRMYLLPALVTRQGDVKLVSLKKFSGEKKYSLSNYAHIQLQAVEMYNNIIVDFSLIFSN